MKKKLQLKREELRLKLEQKQALILEKQHEAVIASTDISEIRELMLNIIRQGKAKITSNDNALKVYFFKYLTMLQTIASEWTIMDVRIINTFIDDSDNIASKNAKIFRCFASYETLAPSSQKQELKIAMESGYITLFTQKIATSTQIRDEVLLLFRETIQKKYFILAKALYEQFGNKIITQNDLKVTALNHSIIAKFDQQGFTKVLELFDINLQTLRSKLLLDDSTTLNLTTAAVIIPYIQEIWSVDNNKAKFMLDYFIKQGLPFKAKESYNHPLIIAMGYKDMSLDFIKLLLDANIVDVNAIITSADDSTCKIVKTPFSVAVGKVNFKLLSLLLEHNADPYLAAKVARSIIDTQSGDKIKIIVTSGLAQNLKSLEEIQKYLTKLDEFIEDFFLTRLAKIQYASVQETTKQSSSASSSSKEEIKLTQDTPELTTILDQYLDYKEAAQSNTELPKRKILEHTFDSLLLKWLKSSAPSLLDDLTALLEENPELHSYSITYLLNKNIATESVGNVYADNPKLLHNFYILKKKLNNNIKIDSEILILQKNVHEVKGNFTNKIFIKISDEMLEELGALNDNYENKVLSQLSILKFIKTNSRDVSGIKSYTSCIKLKIANVDKNLYTTQRYLDQDGNILIIFDKLGGHSNTPYKNKNEGITTIYSDFKKEIYRTDADVTHSDNAGLIILNDSIEAHEISEVAVLGEGLE